MRIIPAIDIGTTSVAGRDALGDRDPRIRGDGPALARARRRAPASSTQQAFAGKPKNESVIREVVSVVGEVQLGGGPAISTRSSATSTTVLPA
jgi:phosphoribosylformimino-5-aminoimidazole carboxamide ribonucleotide (ProFAR) isomerase